LEKIVVVTRKTGLDELVERFNTREQAQFYLEHMGASFGEYLAAHEAYARSLAKLKAAIPKGARSQFIDRSFIPTFTFGERDLVVTLGPDGLVVNTAKYLTTQPLLALNPDAKRIDDILVPFHVEEAENALKETLRGHYALKRISMAKAELNNGQNLYAVNDLFIGQRSHVSALYRLCFKRKSEDQSSSGIIVSTGAGSTGWFRSVVTGAAGLVEAFSHDKKAKEAREKYRFDWESSDLCFSVREPFVSKVSSADLIFGRIGAREHLEVISHMPQNGVIFSDGIETDYVEFNSSAIAKIRLAEKKGEPDCPQIKTGAWVVVQFEVSIWDLNDPRLKA